MFFQTLLSNSKLSQESISKIVKEIKELSRRPLNETTPLNVEQIITHMKKAPKTLEIQRISAHALSNLAMNVQSAQIIVQKGGIAPLLTSLENFMGDNKLCWLATSALWNIARPPANRSHIGVKGVTLCLAALRAHCESERVTNTIIGALSNLCLLDEMKPIIGSAQNLALITSVVRQYAEKKATKVMTSVAGLIANLAVSDDFGQKLIVANVLPLVLKALTWESENESMDTLHRNICAALNNLVTAEGFETSFLLCEGIEIIGAFLRSSENEMLTNLLENVLTNLNTDNTNESTSFHLCASKGNLDILKTLIAQKPYFDLNNNDGRNMSCLDYAIASNHVQCIEFLSRCGAQTNNTEIEMSDDIDTAVLNGEKTLNAVKHLNEKALEDSLQQFPSDLCRFVVGFSSNIDMLQAADLF